jgi:tRNA(Ile)-lysidine synthase
MVVSFRAVGETLQPVGRNDPHTLKNLFQGAAIVPWMRDRLPLLRRGGELLAIANLWNAGAVITSSGEPRVSLIWLDAPSLL